MIRKGFTLAEVLITLAIIGVVAALTIPSIVKNYQKTQTVVKLKKVYNTLSQATASIIVEDGDAKNWATGSNYTMYVRYLPKLKVAKDCKSQQGCFEQAPLKYVSWEKTGTVTDNWNDSQGFYKFILNDGTNVRFQLLASNCSARNYGSENVCGIIEVDINGMKPPNQVGRDVFGFVLKNDRLVPAGCDYSEQCNLNSSGNDGLGFGCTCKVIQENAITY